MLAWPALPLNDAITVESVLAALRVGKANGQTGAQLVRSITGGERASDLRHLRDVVVALRTAGHRICGRPEDGYYLAETADELDSTCEFLYGRSMTSLKQVSAMKRVTLPDLRGQLGLPLKKEAPDESSDQ